jgi:hypothetical protein
MLTLLEEGVTVVTVTGAACVWTVVLVVEVVVVVTGTEGVGGIATVEVVVVVVPGFLIGYVCTYLVRSKTGFGVSSSGGGGGKMSPSARAARPQLPASTNADPTIVKYRSDLFTETIYSLQRGWTATPTSS